MSTSSSAAPGRAGKRQTGLALLAIVVTLFAVWPFAKLQPLSAYDQPFYVGIADDLLREGTFTDGVEFGGLGARPPGMRFAPLYPAMLAGLAHLDGRLARNMDCEALAGGHSETCGREAVSVRAVQFALLAASYWLVWDVALTLGWTLRAAWVALGLAVLTAPLMLDAVNYLMTETVSFFLTSAMTACLVRARSGQVRWALATGAALGLAVLVRPAFLYLFTAMAVLGLGWRVRPLVAFVTGTAVLVLPWILRNAVVVGHAQLTFGYAGHTLAQRVSFDSMSWREYGLSFVCWLPDGNGWGRLLAGAGTCARFGWDERPDTFYAIGMRQLVPETLRAAGGAANQLHWLMVHEVLRHPVWHMAVTVPLALRGLWVDHYWGLLLAPVAIWLTVRSLRHGRCGFAAVALPAFFMLLFNATFAVNQVRYNLMLILPFSLAGSFLSCRIWSAIRARATAT